MSKGRRAPALIATMIMRYRVQVNGIDSGLPYSERSPLPPPLALPNHALQWLIVDSRAVYAVVSF